MPVRQVRPGSRSPIRSSFDYSLEFKAKDFCQHPELYRSGKGEQGLLALGFGLTQRSWTQVAFVSAAGMLSR